MRPATSVRTADRRACVLALLLLAACAPPAPAAPPERIILIVADTLRRDFLSPYGSPVATPHVARLAERGQVFTNAVASFNQTTMSMSAMFTGRTPSIEGDGRRRTLPWTSQSWCGMARFASAKDDRCIPAHLDTLAEDLSAAGYDTLAVVSNRLLFRPLGYEQGFDTWQEVGEKEKHWFEKTTKAERARLRNGKHVNEAVRRVLASRGSDRFFLYVHFIDPHDYDIRADLGDYEAGVRYFDRALGLLIAHLEGEGLLEDALVVFTADHGEYLGAPHPRPPVEGHHGNPSYGSVLRIPLIVSPPTRLDSTRLVRTQDVRSLVRELAGLPALAPADIADDEVLLSERYYQTYRRGRWKSAHTRGRDEAVLYDLENDPDETTDLAALRPEIVARHRLRVRELSRRLGTKNAQDSKLSADDAARLRALGYIE